MKTATFIDDWITEGIEKGMQQGLQQGLQQGMQQGMQQGLQQGIKQGLLQTARDDVIEVLMIRFGELPKLLVKWIKFINNLTVLKNLHRQAVIVETLAKFEDLMPNEDELPIPYGVQSLNLRHKSRKLRKNLEFLS